MIDIRNPHWLAAYTKPRSEKKVFERLVEAGYEVFLPLHKVQRQWSDRKKWVEEPLLRSYIFLRLTEKEYYKAIHVNGLVRYVTFEGKAVPIPDNQIDILKILVGQQLELETTEEIFEPGQTVQVVVGSLSGITGELVRHNGKKKLVIRLDHISHSVLLTLPKGHVIKVQ